MIKRTLITLATLTLANTAALADNPASQSWVSTNFISKTSATIQDSLMAWVTANFTSKTGATINWSSLCPSGQSLTNSSGCTPNCNSGTASSTCNLIFSAGQVEQIAGVPLPYLNQGVTFFKLTQTGGGTGASFNVILQTTPSGFGYQCEILNANGTPATLWDAQTTTPVSTQVITLDASVNPGSPITSDNFVSTVAQPNATSFFWYSNPKNPLYMACVAYQVSGSNLQSSAACGGSANTCITYSFA